MRLWEVLGPSPNMDQKKIKRKENIYLSEKIICSTLASINCMTMLQNNIVSHHGIYVFIKQVQEDMRKGEVELEKYVITKSLTKPPEAYPDKNQPHVQVSCSQL